MSDNNRPPPMMAPEIPNLLSRRGRGGGRGGFGRGQGERPRVPRNPTAIKDRLVQGTDDDANLSRQSAVNAGYLQDRYADEMSIEVPPPKLPIINRGTYVRIRAIDKLVEEFLKTNPEQDKQIISLGAGTDTRYFRLQEKNLHEHVIYHEIDFPEVSLKKFHLVRTSSLLSGPNSCFFALHKDNHNPENRTWGFSSLGQAAGYVFHPVDLRLLPSMLQSLQTGLPTLLISECCLCYLPAESCVEIIDYFTSKIPNLGIIIYEPTNPTSNFGRTMIANLASRNLHMPSIQVYSSLQDQLNRLKTAGFTDGQEGSDIDWLWDNWVSEAEKERIANLEMLDELEEWKMLAQHYLVVWGWREGNSPSGAFAKWREYRGMPKP